MKIIKRMNENMEILKMLLKNIQNNEKIRILKSLFITSLIHISLYIISLIINIISYHN